MWICCNLIELMVPVNDLYKVTLKSHFKQLSSEVVIYYFGLTLCSAVADRNQSQPCFSSEPRLGGLCMFLPSS
jgi:hypothetical protein